MTPVEESGRDALAAFRRACEHPEPDAGPAGLVDLLPRPPRGHAYFAVGGDVVLAVIATGVIVQIVLAGP